MARSNEIIPVAPGLDVALFTPTPEPAKRVWYSSRPNGIAL
jgi:hypothetical protein